ncbi:MAG TPA: NINE protein [Acidisarcina sp.]
MATYPAVNLPTIYAASMTDQQRARYFAELSVVQKDEVLGVLLAVFLGTFGAHHFYMRRNGLGILYCILSVTGFSTIAGFVEAFFMPERVRRYNAMQAAAIANQLGINYGPGIYGPGTYGPGTYSPGTMSPATSQAFPMPSYAPAAGAPFSVPIPTSTSLSNHVAPTVCPSCSAAVTSEVNFCSVCGAAIH